MEEGLRSIEAFLSTTEYSEHLRNGWEDQNTNKAVRSIAAVINDMRNQSMREVVVASLKIVAIMATAAFPGFGPLAGEILLVCSAILSTIWKNTKNTDNTIKDDIKKEERVRELKSKVKGLLATFHVSEAYLSILDTRRTNSKDRDVNYMMSSIDLYQGSEILGNLRSDIEQGLDLNNNGEAKRIICLTNLCKEDDMHKEFLLLLIEPDYDTIHFLTLFNPSEQIEIASFVRSYGLEFQRLTYLLQGEFSIKSKIWENYGIIMSSNFWGSVWGSSIPIKNQNLFRFREVSTEDSIFTIFSIRWSSFYVRMKKNYQCSGYNESSMSVDPQSQWKILRLKNGHFIMSPIQWPCRFKKMMNAEHLNISIR
ncbi:unnamed protein product [Mytilus edulis]|uniref:Uncharacterized protein n=1 Tax=Mytilus edulis TaxID=6550 RepID=A0A8S3Q8C1_MYTED|nr:unnamed protein product [Mytilus edulis]